MRHEAEAAVDGLRGRLDDPAAGVRQGLHPEADAQDRREGGRGRGRRGTRGGGGLGEQRRADADVARDQGRAWPRGDDDAVPFLGEDSGPQLGPGQGVVVEDVGLRCAVLFFFFWKRREGRR